MKKVRLELDDETKKWFRAHPMITETTVMQCENCELYYKPSLGHICKRNGKKK